MKTRNTTVGFIRYIQYSSINMSTINMSTPHPSCTNYVEEFPLEKRGKSCITCEDLGQVPGCIGAAHPRRQGIITFVLFSFCELFTLISQSRLSSINMIVVYRVINNICCNYKCDNVIYNS